jgi:SAM-dependent methyltransferase
MPDFMKYEFGYSWWVANGLLVPFALAVAVAWLALWRGWSRWVIGLVGVVAVWAVVGVATAHLALRINAPAKIPTSRFLPAGNGRVLDAGAGSGRAAVGVLLARPNATVTGLDIYSGYWGIDDNTAKRFMANARIADAADRAEVRVGDMRQMPFGDGEFDGVISLAAIDHLRESDIARTLREAARVLKPGGQALLMTVNPDWVTWLASPALAHHQQLGPQRWRDLLQDAGFVMEEQGRQPGLWYYLARR